MACYTCPICGQEHTNTSAKMAEIVFDFLKMPVQGGNRKQTSLGAKTRCGLISAFDCIQGPAAKETSHAEGKGLRSIWQTAFEAFKTAADKSHVSVSDLPADGFNHAAQMYGHFEAILAYLHETSK